jgi:hypothetical protein
MKQQDWHPLPSGFAATDDAANPYNAAEVEQHMQHC